MKLKKLKTLVSNRGDLKPTQLLVDKQFNNFNKRPEIKNLPSIEAKNTYTGWVVQYTNGSNPDQVLYGFLVPGEKLIEPRLIKVTANGKKDRVTYFGRNSLSQIVLGMGNLKGEPHFVEGLHASTCAISLRLNKS